MTRPRRRRSNPDQAADTVGIAAPNEGEQRRSAPSQALASGPVGEAGLNEPAKAKRKRRPRGKGKAKAAAQAAQEGGTVQPTPPSSGPAQAGPPADGSPAEAKSRRPRQRKRGRKGGAEANANNGSAPPSLPKGQPGTRSQGGSRPHGEGKGQGGSRPHGEGKGQGGSRPHGEGKGQGGSRPHGEGKGQGGSRPHGEGKSQGGRKPQEGVRPRRVAGATRTARGVARNQTEARARPGPRPRPAMRPRQSPEPLEPRSSYTGEFGESWWARRWIDVLESFGFGGRIQRGWSYARSGAVLDVTVSQGRVVARVQGSRTAPYKVSIAVIPLSNAQWERAIDAMADQAIFTAKLLAGEMPREIEQAFATARVSLFPQSVHDLQTDCSCPDYANPCKHVAAVYYLLGERFDADPFLIFELRGRSKDRIIAGLRARRADTTTDEPLPVMPTEETQSLGDLLADFDQPGPEFAQIAPQVAAPTVASAMLRRYGPSPAETTNDLHNAYLLMTKATLERLFAE
ncbi:MAG: SWIM zinc finger family protein [Oscillochloridaceae bacterium umkhey_bin13]